MNLFDTHEEAMGEAMRRRSDPKFDGFRTRVEKSPYQGYVVKSIPVDMIVDHLEDPVSMSTKPGF